MRGDHVPAYWKRRTERLKKTEERETQEPIAPIIQGIREDNYASAARAQAESEREAENDWWRFRLDVAALSVAAVAAIVLLGQQSIMQGQLSEMQAEQRPWVRVTVNPSRLSLTEWEGQRWISLGYGVAVKDFGHLPALNVNPAAVLVSNSDVRNPRDPKLDQTQRQMCDQAEETAKRDPIGRITIFPDEPDVVFSGSGGQWKPAYFYLLGCIDFTYGNGRHGKTAFRYVLGTVKDGLFAPVPFPSTAGVPRRGVNALDWDVPLTTVTFKRDDVGNYPE